ncbi:aldo/keto reductase [Pseudoclavibacter chungangensis]|uniref:Aldo/keto reductase n=1 Tax=Pseudoclavibacter chungangensis TaxID=587635 RepID=A0A7J5BS69_9MICO|nr:aldo/keto reductase [Pseudoclavibacter chungangensis]KAB1656829.1 aldo/keto reductase [Pseudoclavibacter chungangensis]NYJ67283.1 aryl-alcohol dehydrogenase-like predicted oxidoreductase [Pseudoclavibacter chungangensis]
MQSPATPPAPSADRHDVTRLGLGLAAIGRPTYITAGRDRSLGPADSRSVEVMRERTHELLDAAWDLGIRYVDVARSYGLAESFLGSWLTAHAARRAELVIGSKWGYEYVGGWDPDAPVQERKDHSLAHFEAQWPQTLAALGTRPDIYLVHSLTSDSPVLDSPPTLDALRHLRDSGVRVGLSTSGPGQAEVLDRARAVDDSPFSVVQSTWNLLDPSAGPSLEAAHDAGWTVVVKEALANGRLSPAGDEPRVAALAADDDQSVDAFAIGAALAEPWADVVLCGAVTPTQLAENARARPPRVAPALLTGLAEPARRYWNERGERSWT